MRDVHHHPDALHQLDRTHPGPRKPAAGYPLCAAVREDVPAEVRERRHPNAEPVQRLQEVGVAADRRRALECEQDPDLARGERCVDVVPVEAETDVRR